MKWPISCVATVCRSCTLSDGLAHELTLLSVAKHTFVGFGLKKMLAAVMVVPVVLVIVTASAPSPCVKIPPDEQKQIRLLPSGTCVVLVLTEPNGVWKLGAWFQLAREF